MSPEGSNKKRSKRRRRSVPETQASTTLDLTAEDPLTKLFEEKGKNKDLQAEDPLTRLFEERGVAKDQKKRLIQPFLIN